MVIEERDFRLIPVSEASPMFDLELLYTIRPKGKEARQEFKNAGYGMGLETVVKKIAQYRVSSKHEDESIKLLEYFTEFKKELDSLKELCGI